jgi:hypothetical protein
MQDYSANEKATMDRLELDVMTKSPLWDEPLRTKVLPAALCDLGLGPWIEWVYVIDLDSQLFSVDNRVFFSLQNIPRDRDRWSQAFGLCSHELEPKTFSFEICPEASEGIRPQYFVDTGESDRYDTIYRQYSHSMVKAISDLNTSSGHCQALAMELFSKLTSDDISQFWQYLPGWSHEDFAFREVAFAILSLAANKYYFDTPDRFYHKNMYPGYLIDRNEYGGRKLMPTFGSGCHMLGQEPGSAPGTIIYWFENVLISLVPNIVFENDTDAAIAKAVEHGLEEGKTHFQVVVFSILNAIMVEVYVKNGATAIRHTGVVPIVKTKFPFPWSDIDSDRRREIYSTNPIEQFHEYSGFASLWNFFNAAANRRLSVFGQGRLPNEIHAMIISYVDSLTHNVCAKVSRVFRDLCQVRFPCGNDLTIVKFEVLPYHMGGFRGIFTLQNRNTGLVTQNASHGFLTHNKLTTWCPVIGEAAQPSMMTAVNLWVIDADN